MQFDFSSRDTRANLILLIGALCVGLLNVWGMVVFFKPPPPPPVTQLTEKDAETIRELVTQEAPGIYRPVPDPEVAYTLQRDIEKEAFGSLIRTNQAGLRGATLTEKAPGAFRVVCLGDSMTFGYKVPEESAFPSQLREILSAAADRPIEVINCGVPSWNIRSEAHFLRSRLDKLRPDFVIWQIHDNDLGATLGVAEGGFATRDFSPQERELGISYYNGQSALRTRSLVERLDRAAAEIAETRHLLSRERIGLLFYFISDKTAMLGNYVHKFAQDFPDQRAVLHPVAYSGPEYRLPTDPHFNPEGNRIIATGLAWAMQEAAELSAWSLPEVPEAYDLTTTFADLARGIDLDAAQREEWSEVPAVFLPEDETCQRHSIGVMKFGWVAMFAEFGLSVPSGRAGTLRIEGEFLAYPQLTPLNLTFEVGDATHTAQLVDKGEFALEFPVPAERGGPEAKYNGLWVRCSADKYSSALDDPRRLSWVMKRAEFVGE
jgi:lysophospholipase L1-like esterase